MNYKSLLTKDFKSISPLNERSAPRRGGMRHLYMAAAAVISITLVLSMATYDVTAKNHDASNSSDSVQNTQIIVPLDIPLEDIATEANPFEKNQLYTESNWIEVKVKKGDSLARIFKRHDLQASELDLIVKSSKKAKRLRRIQPGQTIQILVNNEGSIEKIIYDVSRIESLEIVKDGETYQASYQHKDVVTRTNSATVTINSSLFESGQQSGLSQATIMELASIFAWDIDFALDIRSGDSFTILYEEQFLEGKKFGDGAILAAEFTNNGHVYRAIRYTDEGGHTDYYNPKGYSMRKAFLRTPVDFKRISSRFGNRKHPVLNNVRMHKGVDYAAPRGTPVRASGDGKIIYVGKKGGYGRTVIIQHGGRYSTLYAHLSKYRRGIKVGKRVQQGDVIAYVGSSGRATGPHLHYEFRVNGVHRNPLTVKLPNAQPIKKRYRNDFKLHATNMISQLEMHKETNVAFKH